MATAPARFEFYCNRGATQLDYTHDVPQELISRATLAGKDGAYDDLFTKVVWSVVKEREQACRIASNTRCDNCGQPTARVLQSTVSWLHKPNDPSIGTWILGLCDKGECEIQLRQRMGSTLLQIGADLNRGTAQSCTELLMCNVCGETAGSKRCARCRAVAYCGKEHQRSDWRRHKESCKCPESQTD
ncbi:globin-like-protein [Purpureocillium lavendulum]|uniref:Globin-like-protein n=1 Tax=Purpureocillium lavendulum TaxID=1247861 RepID=A0AB34FLP6_9HYPO|nr:globin-like-protein [Purpureocillium lavendulum]